MFFVKNNGYKKHASNGDPKFGGVDGLNNKLIK
jgi:hypothetical protein